MVFRGRPSRACQRCRERRLKCDLLPSLCGQCSRAGVACSGYRDTKQLRIRDESQATREKAQSRLMPSSLVLPLEYQAREAFFAHHVTGVARTWSFLLPFYDQTDVPEHLKLTIDAVSLAHLSHEANSATALVTAKKKYVSALHMTSKALQSTSVAMENTTVITSLLLDLFEKITNIEPRHIEAWSSHINGALALVSLRGLDKFMDSGSIQLLARLSVNLVITCVSCGSSIPQGLIEIRSYLERSMNGVDPKWWLSDLILHFANLRSDIRKHRITVEAAISASLELDSKLEKLGRDSPPSWQSHRIFLTERSESVCSDYFDIYHDRHVTQMWNVLRLTRIFLNEYVINNSDMATSLAHMNAKRTISVLTEGICASIPQYANCFEASGRQPLECTNTLPSNCIRHEHSPIQKLDSYTLIYPLFIAGRSPWSPPPIKVWAINRLHYIGEHFGIRNAELVAQILEKGDNVDPWSVYALLGSYAFAA